MSDELTTYTQLTSVEVGRLIWLLARSGNPIEVKKDFQKVFNTRISDDLISSITDLHQTEIKDLRLKIAKDFHSQKLSDANNRQKMALDIYEKAMEGIVVGIDKTGEPVVVPQLKVALSALEFGRNEEYALRNYELSLLKAVLLSKQPNITINGEQVNQPQAVEIPVIDSFSLSEED
jgi:hypothetical protein